MNLQETLLYWAERGIYIDWLADVYTLYPKDPNGRKVCWRPIVNWYQREEWVSDDCGCHNDIDTMLQAVNLVAEDIYSRVYHNKPLSL